MIKPVLLTMTAQGGMAAPPVLSGTLASAIYGRSYSSSLGLSGGTGPYTYSISSGSLQSGLSIDATTGVISGAPLGATATFSVHVVDANSESDTLSVTLTVAQDAQIANVTSILDFLESNGATSISDSLLSGAPTWTCANGAAVSTAKNPNPLGFGNAIHVDGVDDQVATTSSGLNLSLTDWTLEGWMYYDSLSNPLPLAVFWTMASNAAELTNDIITCYIQASGQLQITWQNASGTGQNMTGGPTFPQRTWTHFAFTRSGTTVNCYINGILTFTATLTVIMVGGVSEYHIGTLVTGDTRAMPGYLANVRVTKVARYTGSSFTVPSTPYPLG